MEVHSPESSESSENSPAMRTDDDGHKVLDILMGQEDTPTASVTCQDELELYLAKRPVSQDVQPHIWWKENVHCFSRLAKVARVLLCIPSTSAPTEQIFSNAGLSVTRIRSCLNPETVDSHVFLHENIPEL